MARATGVSRRAIRRELRTEATESGEPGSVNPGKDPTERREHAKLWGDVS